MGKALTRQANRIWNYGFKGVLCSLLLIVVFPVICLMSSVGGVCLAATAPMWAPVAALLYQLCLVLFYDADNPDSSRHGPFLPLIAVLGRDLLVGGILQPVACLLTTFIFCPIFGLLISLCKKSCHFFCFVWFFIYFFKSLFSFQLDSLSGCLYAPGMG